MEILKFGADAEVLSPAAWRVRIKESLKRAAERYA